MKVILYHHLPMMDAQSQPHRDIIQLRDALAAAGVEAEFFRWYDSTQTADVLHFFGRIPSSLVQLAHNKSMRVVFTESPLELPGSWGWRRFTVNLAKKLLPYQVVANFDWESYHLSDACIVETSQEADYLREVHGVAQNKIHVLAKPGADFAGTATKLKALYEGLRTRA